MTIHLTYIILSSIITRSMIMEHYHVDVLPKPEDNLGYFQNVLGCLKIPKDFNKIIEPGDIPEGIHTIKIGDNFDLIQPYAIPDSVICVSILSKIKKDIILRKGYLPRNLERLDINKNDYRYEDYVEVRIDDIKDLKCLTHLKIIGSVKCDLSYILCQPITHLYVSFSSDYDIYCPDSVEHLYLICDHNDNSCGEMPIELPFLVKNIYIIDNYFEDRGFFERVVWFMVPKMVKNIYIWTDWSGFYNYSFKRGTEEFDRHFDTLETVGKSAVE